MITLTIAIGLLIFLPMAGEALRASRNERAQRARGGVEPAGDVYPIMRIVYPAAFLAMLLELVARFEAPIGSSAFFVAGLAVFGGAKIIKYAAIAALGRSWTFRVIVVPGDALVSRGVYRYFRHPNYIGVIGELIGAALMTHAIVTGPVAVVVFAVLLKKRIAVEERALASSGSVI